MEAKWLEIEDPSNSGTRSFVLKTVTGWVLRVNMERYFSGISVSAHMVTIEDSDHTMEFQYKTSEQS